MKTTLYKRAKSGKIQQWTIELSGNGYFTSEGYSDGVKSTTETTWCFGKREGSSNATTDEEQTLKEAEAKITKQLKRDWSRTLEGIDSAARKHLPMLAHKYEDHIETLLNSGCTLALQPKLDGIRNIDTTEGPFSKEGTPGNPAAWILHEHSMKMLEGLEPFVKLDGELYNHEYKADFNAIVSIVRKQKPNEEELAFAKEKLQYHLYDIPSRGTFVERYSALRLLLEDNPHPAFKLVETVFIDTKKMKLAEILDKMFELHTKWVKEGYEGSMIRNAESLYEPKRVKNLLKRKDWIEEEFKIVDFHSGKGNKAGIAASVTCVDERGELFDAGIIGDEKYCKELLLDKHSHIGKMATIKYQNLTPDRKVPRFAKMKAIRDYE